MTGINLQRKGNEMKAVVSLFEYTGTMLRPWAEAGYTCYAYDIQHKEDRFEAHGNKGGGIHYLSFDADDPNQWITLLNRHKDQDVAMVFSFPPCTDLAVSGARHWETKRKADPSFQEHAAERARNTVSLALWLNAPYMIENPVGALSRFMGKAQHSFHPYEYGGYIKEENARHPVWPEYIADRDAYPKKTLIWSGHGFRMPEKKPVVCPEGYSKQHLKLGGKSEKTKNIRSATPRGFAQAVFEANSN